MIIWGFLLTLYLLLMFDPVHHINFVEAATLGLSPKREETALNFTTKLYMSSGVRGLGPDYLLPNISAQDLKEALQEEGFQFGKELVVLIHGFRGSIGENSSMGNIKRGYLNRTDANLILVDWTDLAQNPNYRHVSGNISRVAIDISESINRLYRIDFIGRLHLIGYSLGAQICGLMAPHLTRAIDRITALDPAGVRFGHLPPHEKLTADDARFVMVVHSSGDILSFSQPIGDADFYPNGGNAPQPKCSSVPDIFAAVICSHKMAPAYFADSLYRENSLVATPCESWVNYKAGNCGSNLGPSVVMGYNTPECDKKEEEGKERERKRRAEEEGKKEETKNKKKEEEKKDSKIRLRIIRREKQKKTTKETEINTKEEEEDEEENRDKEKRRKEGGGRGGGKEKKG
ncbi:hypothetical protein M8J77_016063 [Diaphorina citri]|nr:hypothetical protein M8J77_016063 [Diaphorina citri]